MRTIEIIDHKNYDPSWERVERQAVRGIIFVNGLLAMVKSEKYGEYKFLGGGIKEGENHTDTLIREVAEEAGLHVLPHSIAPYGKTVEFRAGDHEDVIFTQTSYYYSCEVDPNKADPPRPEEGYERDYGYKPVFVTLEEAIATNEKSPDKPQTPWRRRDLAVLKELLL